MFRRLVLRSLIFTRQTINRLLEPVLGYSRIVMGTKVTLLLVACILTIAIFVFPLLKNPNATLVPANIIEKDRTETTPTMINPKFQGIDSKNGPFEITSDSAAQASSHRIVMTNVQANILPQGESPISASAVQAIYSIPKKTLDLLGAVTIVAEGNYKLLTNTAHINLKTKMANGLNNVTLTSDWGVLKADRFNLTDYEELTFEGSVKMTLYPKKMKATIP